MYLEKKYKSAKLILNMHFVVFLPLLLTAKAKCQLGYNDRIEEILLRSTSISVKCHNKNKEWRKHLFVTVSYEIFLQNGTKMDTVNELVFKYGGKSVIQGINEGIYGMCQHEEKVLLLPANKVGLERLDDLILPNENVILKIRLLQIDEFQKGYKKNRNCNCNKK